VTLVKKSLFFILLFNLHFVTAQDKIPLREYLVQIENQFPVNFSFKDADLASHYINPTQQRSFEAALLFLRANTLFFYDVLEDRTVAMKIRDGLIPVCGVVFSSETDTALSTAGVITPYQRITTQADGTFEVLLRTSEEPVTLQYTGFATQVFKGTTFQNKPCKKIAMTLRVEYLSTVTLSNYFAKGITKNENGSLTVNYDDFDILPGLIEPDVLLTIQALPGIQSVNETVSFINIRGGTNDQNLILWDGIKMYQNGHFFGLISAFNPFLTQNVTLIKNGTPASFGDGVSGVISMEGANEINSKFTVGAGLNLLSTDVFANVPLGNKGSLQVSGRKSINNFVETPTYNAYFDKAFQNTELTMDGENVLPNSNDAFSFFDSSLRIQFKASEKDDVRMNLLILANDLKFQENAEINDEPLSLKSDLVQNNISGGLYYKRQWSADFSTDLQLYGSSYELQALNADILNEQALLQENDVLESGFKLSGSFLFSENVKSEFGYQLNETGITNFEQINNPFFERRDKEVLLTHSFFGETHFQPFPATSLNLGVRVNHIGKFNELLWEPRLSFNYQLTENISFEILGELKSQTTSQITDFQNDFLGVENRRWVLSKPGEIPIIKGQQLSAGITFSRKGWLVSAEPYLKRVKGITSQSQGFQNQFQDEKTQGSYTIKGVDFLLNKRFENVNTWLSYSYAKNDYQFDAFIPQEFFNTIDIRHLVTYGINYSVKDFNISGGFNWHSGKPTTLLVEGSEIVDGELNFSLPNATNIKDYIRVDVSGTYAFSLGGKATAFAGLSIWNLLNTQNVVNHFFRIDSNETVEEIDELALKFTPNLSFRITF
jgi:hypothetical protein